MGQKKPGLWHGPRRVEVQDVKPAHKMPCSDCQKQPEERRLVVTDGAGRRATTIVFCEHCGAAWLRERRAEADRAVVRLTTGQGAIRL